MLRKQNGVSAASGILVLLAIALGISGCNASASGGSTSAGAPANPSSPGTAPGSPAPTPDPEAQLGKFCDILKKKNLLLSDESFDLPVNNKFEIFTGAVASRSATLTGNCKPGNRSIKVSGKNHDSYDDGRKASETDLEFTYVFAGDPSLFPVSTDKYTNKNTETSDDQDTTTSTTEVFASGRTSNLQVADSGDTFTYDLTTLEDHKTPDGQETQTQGKLQLEMRLTLPSSLDETKSLFLDGNFGINIESSTGIDENDPLTRETFLF